MCAKLDSEKPAPPAPVWVEVRDPLNPAKLLCRYDPVRHLVEIVVRGEKRLVDLTEYLGNTGRTGRGSG